LLREALDATHGWHAYCRALLQVVPEVVTAVPRSRDVGVVAEHLAHWIARGPDTSARSGRLIEVMTGFLCENMFRVVIGSTIDGLPLIRKGEYAQEWAAPSEALTSNEAQGDVFRAHVLLQVLTSLEDMGTRFAKHGTVGAQRVQATPDPGPPRTKHKPNGTSSQQASEELRLTAANAVEGITPFLTDAIIGSTLTDPGQSRDDLPDVSPATRLLVDWIARGEDAATRRDCLRQVMVAAGDPQVMSFVVVVASHGSGLTSAEWTELYRPLTSYGRDGGALRAQVLLEVFRSFRETRAQFV
jgi:hypothetical protein